MSEKRIAISRTAAAYAEKVMGQRAIADAEAMGFMRGLALGIGIDPASIVRIDTDADELVIFEPGEEEAKPDAD